MSESVIIHTFKPRKRPIVFHRINGLGTVCDPRGLYLRHSPRVSRSEVEGFARPCERCYPIPGRVLPAYLMGRAS